MSGYDGYSMSNNARAAYASGEMPASRVAAATGLTTAEVRRLDSPSSWHHTSKKFNSTDFYELDSVLEAANAHRIELRSHRRPALRRRLIVYVQERRRLAASARRQERERLRLAADRLIAVTHRPLLQLPPAPSAAVAELAARDRFRLEMKWRRRDSRERARIEHDRFVARFALAVVDRCLPGIPRRKRAYQLCYRDVHRALRREFSVFPTRVGMVRS